MKTYVRSFGCSANTADSQVLSGCLANAGYRLTDSETDADVIIYNSCAVKGPTENRIIDALKRIPPTKKVVVAGCLPLVSFERLLREVRFDAVVGPAAGESIVQVVQRVLNGETVTQLEDALTAMPPLNLPRIQTNPVVSVVPVNYGCLGSCAFCCVVNARGHLRSYSITEVVERFKHDVAAGAKEFWVTSQDTACYGREIGTNLAELLTAVVSVKGDFRVRVGMMTPNLITPFRDQLIETYSSPKVFKFIHLPVQSGDDKVLRRMQRFHTAAEFKQTVAAFRKAFPEITVNTDVICGFPGETAPAFENTLKLLREVSPDVVNVSKFFARPQTAAWQMHSDAVDKVEIKRRSTEAAKVAKQVALERNLRWVGWSGEILVDEKGKVEGTWIGRNFAYKPVAVKSNKDLLGKTIKVQVVKAFSTHLTAETQ
ncbi:MAG: tRNA (N(6)-L-threonylcarbamoyladenosine(37)-C(2))-methylthiotransferase [Candidatus Bathyarchaeota archaeon]|nr:tRNA (N(6)-L-threonylcarbamoyladenosine(37)-C(2))-methylthiotransferase [Candidatus Bathyarchaeota archaeon]